MYDKTVRRRRAALLVFVALSLGLLTVYFGESAAAACTRSSAAPRRCSRRSSRAPAGRSSRSATRRLGRRRHRRQAREQEAEGRGRATCARSSPRRQTAERETEQLRGLVGCRRTSSSRRAPAGDRARDRALADGLALERPDRQGLGRGDRRGHAGDRLGGDGGGGLAGKVTSVTGGTATVTLITDESSAVSARSCRTAPPGSSSPRSATPTDMLLDFIEKGEPSRRARR